MRTHWRGKLGLTVAALSAVAVGLSTASALALNPTGVGINEGSSSGTTAATTWPGDAAVSIADDADVFGTNLSGLSFESPSVLWAVKNGPGTVYRLVPDGAKWHPDPADGWAEGKALHYGAGGGDPDAEGVVATPDGLFVATERDQDDGASLPKVLRFDVSSSADSLDASAEWDLTSDLPEVSANSGPEAISWIPDTFLTAQGFHDENTDAAYDPGAYPGHGSGLYFVGLEDNGTVYAYALDQSGDDYTRVATVPSGLPENMGLEFEPETGRLWASCDDNCQGRTTTLELTDQGRFAVTAEYDRPAEMPDYNNEGLAIAPEAVCASGFKPVLWADDDNDDGHALRGGKLPCTTGQNPDPDPTDPPGEVTLISQGKPATASSNEDSTLTPGKAFDGDATTRWASAEGTDPQWIRVDLGEGATISQVKLTWEAAYATAYRVQTSTDGTNWTDLANETAGDGGTDDWTNLNGTGRFLRVHGTERATEYGYSLFEVEVYGTTG